MARHFIKAPAVGKGELSTEQSSTPSTAKTAGDAQPTGQSKEVCGRKITQRNLVSRVRDARWWLGVGLGFGEGALATALSRAGSPAGSVLAPDSGRLPRASMVSIVLGAVLVCGLAGLTWMVVCRW